MNIETHHTYYDHIPLPILIVTPQGTIIYHNAEGKKLINQYSTDSSCNICSLWHSLSKKQLSDYLANIQHSRDGETVEVTLCPNHSPCKQNVRLTRLGKNQILFIIHKTQTPDEEATHHVSVRSQLQELQQKHDSLIKENSDGIVTVDQTGRITGINQALQNMIGYSEKEIALTYERHFPFEELIKIKHYLKKALIGKAHVYETYINHKNGELIYLQVKTIPIKVNSSIIGVYNIFKDVSAYKCAQKEAIEQEEQLRSLIDSIPEFVIFKDYNGRVLEMNQYSKEIFNLEKEDYKGKTCDEIGCGDIDSNRLLSDNTVTDYVAWDKKSKIQYEYKLKKENGEELTFEIVKAPGFSLSGEPKYLIAIGRDISSRKKVEEDLKETTELLESIFLNSADGISVINLNGEIIKTNPAFKRLYGYTDSDVPKSMANLYPADNVDEAKEIFETVIEGKGIIDFQSIRKHKDGSLIEVSVTYSPIQDEHGNLAAISAITRDISDRKRTEELLMRSEKLSAIGQLSAAVAHEVRNPLTAVKGFIQLYKDKINPEIQELMLSEMVRIEDIITEFLSLAKPQAVTYQQTDLNELIRNTLAIMETQARMNNVDIQTVFNHLPKGVYCERNQIKQVLMNIIKNGIESMPNGGLLSITTTMTDTFVSIIISDQGVGISKERLKHLGEPFFSNKEAGTGLGLVVCYKIIHEHGGLIEFNSEREMGTTVTIVLPFLAPKSKFT
ncbi:PAS domain S-box protein [Pseudalkalibacillus hwajinpoensis]|uniref:PAS domain S-box protein n=1 Tax=Guptibacillus hwajinpoensis TaxID=208199 RepID=UPI00325AA8D5